MIINDEVLSSVSGGAMQENDLGSLKDFLRLEKDMGATLKEMLDKVEYEYNNKIDYYDLLDDSGNPLSLDVLKDSVKKVWEELGY